MTTRPNGPLTRVWFVRESAFVRQAAGISAYIIFKHKGCLSLRHRYHRMLKTHGPFDIFMICESMSSKLLSLMRMIMTAATIKLPFGLGKIPPPNAFRAAPLRTQRRKSRRKTKALVVPAQTYSQTRDKVAIAIAVKMRSRRRNMLPSSGPAWARGSSLTAKIVRYLYICESG